MPRFLSRAGTHIDDLERQLARVGSADDDDDDNDNNTNDDAAGSSTKKHADTGETTPLLKANRASQSMVQLSVDQTTVYPYNTLSPVLNNTQPNQCHISTTDLPPPIPLLAPVAPEQAAPRKLGTWDGVFLPVMLSIWGILVYVRMGYFLGQIGVIGTIGSFVCGYLVTTMTTLSISAISTNGTVKGGGPYYMLSRSLGPEFGGSIGLMFYAGTLLSGALNAVAFVEPLVFNFGQRDGDISQTFPEGPYWDILYSSLMLTFCTVVCLIGARAFAKASTVLSTLIVASTAMILASFALRSPFVDEERSVYYTGWSADTLRENLWPELTPISPGQPPETFGAVLGVLFPACIGIMAGASMSASLRKPSKSIPKGTLWAILITFCLYMLIIVSLGATTRRVTLRENFNVLQEINIFPVIVPIGAITTSVTSTLSGVLSAASVLQAIAKDDLFGCLRPFKRLGRGDSPVRAIIATYVLSQLAFFVGGTNAVAPYATVFNLIMFAFVNLACLVLKLAASVNFRPTFHYFKAWTAFLGVTGCFAIMVFVNMVSSLVSTAFVLVLFLYVHYTCPPKPWGDVTQSLIYHQCRKFMLRLDVRKDHVKFWRPQILLLVHDPRSSISLIRFCNALKKGGLYVIGHVIKGRFGDLLPEFKRQEGAWMRLIDVLRVKAFLNLVVDEEDDRGARSIAFGAGLGGMRPNIVVMGFFDLAHRDREEQEQESETRHDCDGDGLPTDGIRLNSPISPAAYVRIIEDVLTMGKAVGIAHGFSKLPSTSFSATDQPWLPHLASAADILLPGHHHNCNQKRYIDLWPIQIGSTASVVGNSNGGEHAAYLTNFDSYVMVLQLGTVLHLVPHWHKHYVLRVMCFVEDLRDVDEEYRRVDKLLRDLRVVAELHVHCLRGAGIFAYDNAVSASSTAAAAAAADVSASAVSDTTDSGPGFGMRVNLPMPLRYEATRKDRRRSSSSSSSGSSSSEDEDNDGDQDSLLPDTLLLRKFATVAVGESTINGGSSLFQRLRKSSADHQHHQYNTLSRLPVKWKPRRRSDGSMVLSDFYSQALMASTTSASASAANSTNCIDQPGNPPTAAAAVPEPIKGVADSEFNDMPANTQNLILNELMRRESKQGTALIFTTLQAPELGTWEKDNRAMEYLQDIDTLAHDLPPVFLVHATSLTVTTSL